MGEISLTKKSPIFLGFIASKDARAAPNFQEDGYSVMGSAGARGVYGSLKGSGGAHIITPAKQKILEFDFQGIFHWVSVKTFDVTEMQSLKKDERARIEQADRTEALIEAQKNPIFLIHVAGVQAQQDGSLSTITKWSGFTAGLGVGFPHLIEENATIGAHFEFGGAQLTDWSPYSVQLAGMPTTTRSRSMLFGIPKHSQSLFLSYELSPSKTIRLNLMRFSPATPGDVALGGHLEAALVTGRARTWLITPAAELYYTASGVLSFFSVTWGYSTNLLGI